MGKFLDNTGLTKLVELIKGSLPGKATSSTLGLVKPDNSTITIDSDGIISSSGGGGSSYTGGLGITIDSNNVINNENYDLAGLFQILIGLGNGTAESVIRSIYSNNKDSLINYLKKQQPCYISGTGNSLTQAELYNLGFRYGVAYNRLTGERKSWGTYTSSSGGGGPIPSRYSLIIPMGSFLFIATGSSTDFRLYDTLNLIPDLLYYNNTTSGLTSTTIKGALDELATAIDARIPDTLVSTETTPEQDGTINWVYE